MASRRIFWVERQGRDGIWRFVTGTCENRSFCEGYVCAMDSLYSHKKTTPKYRVVASESFRSDKVEVIREGGGRGPVQVH